MSRDSSRMANWDSKATMTRTRMRKKAGNQATGVMEIGTSMEVDMIILM